MKSARVVTVLIDLDCRLVVGVDFDCDAAIQHITYHYLIDTAYSLITPLSIKLSLDINLC